MKKITTNSITFYNILSTIILSGINFLTIPIFTRILGAEQYGKYSVFNAWLMIASCVMGLKTQSSLATAMYTFDDYRKYRKSVFSLGLIISCVISALIFIVCCVIPFREKNKYLLVLVFIVCALSNYVIEFTQLSFTYEKKAKQNFIISVFISCSSIFLSLVLLSYISIGELYFFRVLGMAIPYFFGALILSVYFIGNNSKIYNKDYWKFSLVVGFPIVFHALSQNILSQSDRIMMKGFGSPESVIGIYSFFYTFTNVISIILNALNNSWCPFYYDDLSKGKNEVIIKKMSNYIELFTVLTCGFVLLSKEFSYWFSGEEYSSGVKIIPILVLAVYFIFTYQFPVNFEFYNKKTKIIAIGTVISGLANICLNYIMIPRWGMYGAALATVFSYAILSIAHYIIAYRIKEILFRVPIRKIVTGVIVVLITSGIFYVLEDKLLIRWGIACVIGFYEIIRILKRKSIW